MRIQLSAWAESIGIMALVLSLVFVGVEIRQNSNATEAQALLELNLAVSDLQLAQAEDGEFAEIIEKGRFNPESLSDAETYRFQNWAYAMLSIHENAYVFFSKGMLEDDHYEAWSVATCKLLSQPGIRAMWKNEFLTFQVEFEEYIVRRCEIPRQSA